MVNSNAVNNKRIAKNTFFLYGRMLFVLFVSIYTTRVVLNVLGIEDYGIYNVVCGFVAMFGFLNTSLSNGIQRFYNFEYAKGGNEGMKKVFQTAIVIQLLLAIFLSIIVEVIGIWYINSKMIIPDDRILAANWIFQFSVISLIFVILQVPFSASILAHERMDFYALVSIIDVLLKLGIVLLLPFLTGDKLIIYGVLQLLVSVLNFLFYYVYSKNTFREMVFEKSFHRDIFKSISTFSGWNVFATFAWMMQGQGVNMVINLFLGAIVNAARGVSGQIQSAIQGFCENLVVAFRPQLVQSYAEGNLKRTEHMMFSMSKIMYILFFMFALPICVEIDYILNIWLGENVPKYTSGFTILILVSMLPRNFTMAFAQVVHATGELSRFQIITAVIVLLTLPASYVALKLGFNVMSVYWINLLMCVVLFVACLMVLKTVFPIHILDYIRKVVLPCVFLSLISIPIVLIPRLLMASSFLRLMICCISSVVVVMALSYFIILDNDERYLLKNLIMRKK